MKRFAIGASVAALLAVTAYAMAGVASGQGAFKASTASVAQFRFTAASADTAKGGARGTFSLVERSPRSADPIHKLNVKVQRFDASGHSATFGGPGIFDGKEVSVVVAVVDGGRQTDRNAIVRDSIKVAVMAGDHTVYSAGGAVARGDIIVRTGGR
jgi:hypothetical protein